MKLKRRYLLLCAVLSVLVALKLADWRFPLKLPQQHSGFAVVVTDRYGEPLRTFADAEGVWRYQISADQVSPLYLEALLSYEDRFFYQHPGVNPLSLLRAFGQYLYHGEVVSGGSTLTMQVARILHPHSRSLPGKLKQMLRALQLEWHLSKREILELYLNYAPFGGTISGVQAASLQYLHKPASELRPSEAALLAVLPQAPSFLRPDRHPERAQGYRDKVLDRLVSFGIWDLDEVLRAKQEQVAVWPLQQEVIAPLLSRRLKQNSANQPVIQSTIDKELQQRFADYVKSYVARLPDNVSAAALLLDNQSHEVLAYVGSADLTDAERFGHVDMVKAVRSPGSTLKPFLTAMALDEHLIHSQSLLVDAPRLGAQYRPGNFSEGFSGPVSVTEALQRSLNLPFVQLVDAYGAANFRNKLQHVGAQLRFSGEANPAIVLGGAGSSLEDLVMLYSAFANKGRVSPLIYRKSVTGRSQGRQLFSEGAGWITWQMLTGIESLYENREIYSRALLPEIGWKTGTSWGYRDVWAVGVSSRYTLGVWLGRPDGQPMAKTMGRILAGPLMFDLFAQLPHDRTRLQQPETVTEVSICWPDGRAEQLADGNCDRQRSAMTLSGVTPKTLVAQPEPEQGHLFHTALSAVTTDESQQWRLSAEAGCQGKACCAMISLCGHWH